MGTLASVKWRENCFAGRVIVANKLEEETKDGKTQSL